MGNWQEKGINIKRHLEKGDCDMAETECKNILLSHPAQIDPLVMIVDIYISHNMHKEAIKYADVLIKKDKKNYLGYERAGKSLISLGKFERAKKVIEEGLEIIPNHLQLLIIGIKVTRALNENIEALELSKRIIKNYPNEGIGYCLAATNLSVLGRFEEAQIIINEGNKRIPYNINILLIATAVHRTTGNHEDSLKYAEVIIERFENNWQGYQRAAHDLINLKKYNEALLKIETGLEKIPNNIELLNTAMEISDAIGSQTKCLEYSNKLIRFEPCNWKGYEIAAKYLQITGKEIEAQNVIDLGLTKNPDSSEQLNISAEYYAKKINRDKLKNVLDQMIIEGTQVKGKVSMDLYYALVKSMGEKRVENGYSKNYQYFALAMYSMEYILSGKEIPFNIINAPKNACTTIKNSLLKRKEPSMLIHNETHKLHGKLEIDKPFIILTRNPFKRFISAYYDKIGPEGDRKVWENISGRYGFNINETPCMEEILEKLIEEKNFHKIDRHFQPQSTIFCSQLITPELIYRFEDIQQFEKYMIDNDIKIRRYEKHSVKLKACRPNELNKSVVDKILKFYKKDFIEYDYSPSPYECNAIPIFRQQKQKINPFLNELNIYCRNREQTSQSINLTQYLAKTINKTGSVNTENILKELFYQINFKRYANK